eukprot:s374_g4.t1
MSHLPPESQVQRGSIQCRKDPKDLAEWQFALEKEVAYKDTKSKHTVAFEANQKIEALEWMKARQHGSMNGEEGCQAEDALSDVLGSKEKKMKSQLALMDKEAGEPNEEEEDEEEEHPKQSSKAAAALKTAVEDAEVLSDLGKSQNKEQAAKRVLKMIKVIKDVKKTAGGAGQKALTPALEELEKLSKKGKKLSIESCKDILLDAALAVKKVQKSSKG